MYFSKIFGLFSLAAAASAASGMASPPRSSQFHAGSVEYLTDGRGPPNQIVSYDTGYDDGSRSMTAVSCSDGTNGLITRYGWQTQSAIPNFPYIGGADAIPGWNSPNVSSAVPPIRPWSHG